ncbi:MAG: phosphotransferase [Planctomycetota bacterium]
MPRKRAVFRYSFHGESLYLKIFTKEDHKVAAEDLQRISQLQSDYRFAFQVPQLIAYDPDVHVIFMNEIAGDQVTKSYSFRDSNLWERCGDGLATLHKLKAIEGLPEWTVKDEFRAIEKGSQELILAIPGVEAAVESLLESLRQRLPEMERYSPRAIHANLFGDQMLDDGEKLGIVDWEDLCLGDPCFDMGRLGAHILSCAVTTKFPLDHAQRALVCIESAHREALNDDFLQPHRFAWHLIGALLLRAKIRSLRQLPKHWEVEIVALVNMAAEIREGSLGPWRLPSRR